MTGRHGGADSHHRREDSDVRALNPYLESRLRRFGQAGPVLDLGCGRGAWLDLMGKSGLRALGAEPEVDRVGQAAGFAPVVAADGARLPLRDASIGLVWCIHVLHHLEGPDRVLAEISRVLRPGGHLILAETVEDNPLVHLGRRVHPEWDGVPIQSRFTADGLLSMVGDAGLTVAEHRQHGLLSFAAWALPVGARPAWLALSRFERALPARLQRWGAHVECVARAG